MSNCDVARVRRQPPRGFERGQRVGKTVLGSAARAPRETSAARVAGRTPGPAGTAALTSGATSAGLVLEKEDLAAQEAERPVPLRIGLRQRQPALGQRPGFAQLAATRGEPCLRRRSRPAGGHDCPRSPTTASSATSRTARFIHAMFNSTSVPLLSTSAHAQRRRPIGEPSSIRTIVRRRDTSVIRSSPKKIRPKSGDGDQVLVDGRAGERFRRPT